MKSTVKARATKPGRSKKVACPTCGVLYTPGVGLASHIRLKHGNAPQALPVARDQAIKTGPAIQETVSADPRTHLQNALDQLITRKSEIDHALGKADMLREEWGMIGKRIEAVQVALKSWDQSMAASG
jgi:hypothetical protein